MIVEKRKFSSFADLLTYILEDIKVTNTFKECKVPSEETPDLDFFILALAKKKGWKPEKTLDWLNSINDYYPAAALNIMFREIALYCDNKYADHIKNCEEVYIVSTVDGRIHKVCKAHIKSYKNFAAFRTLEDAKYACRLLKEQLKAIF